jgi:hypothetical protein
MTRMEPTKEFIEQLHREDIEQAKQMTLEDKILAGAELFDYACEITKAGIRSQYPHLSDAEVLSELIRRVELRERRKARA